MIIKRFKMVLICVVILLLIFTIIESLSLRGSVEGMERKVRSLNQPMTTIAHVERLGKMNAIVFYEWGTTEQYFGIARMKRSLLSWYFDGGSTSAAPKDHKFGWSYSNLTGEVPYKGIFYGKIFDPEIEGMTLKSSDGREYSCNIVEYGSGERFWFYLTDKVELSDSIVIAYSHSGEILEQYPSQDSSAI